MEESLERSIILELLDLSQTSNQKSVRQAFLRHAELVKNSLGFIVENLCRSGNVDLDLLQWLIQLDPSAVSAHVTEDGRSILHETIDPEGSSYRPNVVHVLVKNCPDLRRARDENGEAAIDDLAERMVRLQEVLKYNRASPSEDEELQNMWLCAEHLLQVDQRPFLHSLMMHATEIPMSLLSHALRRYQCQLLQADECGNLPLHILMLSFPPDEDNDEDTILPVLRDLLRRQPHAASIRNKDNLYPIDLAIRQGRGWSNGVLMLLNKYQGGTTFENIPIQYFPVFIEGLLRRNMHSVVYSMLRQHMDSIGKARR